MSWDNRVVIERATNGFTVQMRDPKIVAANKARDFSSKNTTPYQDPERTYVFTSIEGVTTFLTGNLDKALTKDDYTSSFDAAAEAAESDD